MNRKGRGDKKAVDTSWWHSAMDSSLQCSSGLFTNISFSFFQAHDKIELPILWKVDLAMYLALANKM